MQKVYQVAEIFACIGEIQTRIFGTYSTKELAEERKIKVIKSENVDPKYMYIKEIELDVDIND